MIFVLTFAIFARLFASGNPCAYEPQHNISFFVRESMCLLYFCYYYDGGGARFRRYSFQGWQCVLSNVPEKGRRRPERISKKCGFDGGLAMGPMLSRSVVGFSSLFPSRVTSNPFPSFTYEHAHSFLCANFERGRRGRDLLKISGFPHYNY